MCGFTILKYSDCGHQVLSTMPEHTCLCAYADFTPSPCIPTNDSDTIVAAGHKLFDHCPVFRSEVDASEPRRAQRRDFDDILQAHVHVKEDETGCYVEYETSQLSGLRVYIEEKIQAGMAVAETLETFLTITPEALTRISNNAFRTLLLQPGVEKYNGLYLDAFRKCGDMVPILEMYVRQKVSNKVFVETFI